MNNFTSLTIAAAYFFMPGTAFWPYAVAFIILVVGLLTILRNELPNAKGVDRIAAFGPLFFAVAIAVFGVDHFIATDEVRAMVPKWIPWHLFWAYFVGVSLIAAAFAFTLKKYTVLAGTLLGAMILSFVFLIHTPNLASHPQSRLLLAVLLRDVSFSGGAFAFAIAGAGLSGNAKKWTTTLVRLMIAIPTVYFGVEQYLHPELVPVVPLDLLTPSWIPGQTVISYLTGLVLIAGGLAVIVNWKSHAAAIWMGAYVFVIVLLVYLPIVLAKPSDIENGLNYLVDTLMFGGALLLLGKAVASN